MAGEESDAASPDFDLVDFVLTSPAAFVADSASVALALGFALGDVFLFETVFGLSGFAFEIFVSPVAVFGVSAVAVDSAFRFGEGFLFGAVFVVVCGDLDFFVVDVAVGLAALPVGDFDLFCVGVFADGFGCCSSTVFVSFLAVVLGFCFWVDLGADPAINEEKTVIFQISVIFQNSN